MSRPIHQKIGDREVYPAVWITLAAGGAAWLLWRFALGQPTISGCWFFSRFHIYCPACGGTRALLALAEGHPLLSAYYHPAVLFTAVSAAAYLTTQTVWRLRGLRGWTLHYRNRWLWCLAAILLFQCVLRNILWFAFHIPL